MALRFKPDLQTMLALIRMWWNVSKVVAWKGYKLTCVWLKRMVYFKHTQIEVEGIRLQLQARVIQFGVLPCRSLLGGRKRI